MDVGDQPDQLRQIRSDERLAARDVEPVNPQCGDLADQVTPDVGRKPLLAARRGAHEAVPAREVAGVVGVQPRFAQPREGQMRGPPEVRRTFTRRGTDDPVPDRLAHERVHMDPRPAGLQAVLGGVAAHQLRECRRGAAEVLEQPRSSLICRDPIRRLAVDYQGPRLAGHERQ